MGHVRRYMPTRLKRAQVKNDRTQQKCVWHCVHRISERYPYRKDIPHVKAAFRVVSVLPIGYIPGQLIIVMKLTIICKLLASRRYNWIWFHNMFRMTLFWHGFKQLKIVYIIYVTCLRGSRSLSSLLGGYILYTHQPLKQKI